MLSNLDTSYALPTTASSSRLAGRPGALAKADLRDRYNVHYEYDNSLRVSPLLPLISVAKSQVAGIQAVWRNRQSPPSLRQLHIIPLKRQLPPRH